jgi:hypothetical protein
MSTITGTIADRTAVKGETIEIGPEASAAYRKLIAAAEQIPARIPFKMTDSEKLAPAKRLKSIASRSPKEKATVVTVSALTFLAAIAPTKSA